jgi:Na+/proline symporter
MLARSSESVHSLVEAASSFGSSGLLVIAIFGLFTRFGGKNAALAALIAGVISIILADYVFSWDAPFLFSIGAALIAYTTIALIPHSGRPQSV